MIKAWQKGKTSCHFYYAHKYVLAYPNDMYGWIVLADALAGMALYEEAENALQKSLKLCSPENHHQVYSQLGRMYNQKCDLKRAEKSYRKAIHQYPTQEYLVLLGACLAQQGKFKEAKTCHRRAVRIKPESADEAYLNLGLIARAEGKYKKALTYFDKAIDIDPDYNEAKFNKQDIKDLLKIRKREKE